ncbi:MAG: acyl carrier protein [Planctomycetes bacterium]|nr:acyl carrier protein [Planctomycetota bacterium]
MDKELEDKIKEMIVERCFLTIGPEEIDDEADLMDDVGLDSVQILEVVVGLEDEFGVTIDDSDFDIENFETVAAIADYVRDNEETGQ